MIKKIIKNILPDRFKKKLNQHYAAGFKKNHRDITQKWDKKINLTQLDDLHLKNLIALPDRKALLKRLPNNGIVAELGVDEGLFTKMILEINNPGKLHLIDIWNSDRYGKNKEEKVKSDFSKYIESGNVQIDIGFSTEVALNYPDKYFDWIYIDTDHSYQTTIKELNLYAPKMKKYGIIAGHDYERGHWGSMLKYGVVEAVHEFCVKNNWEIIFLTMDNREYRSFAIRRIS